MYFRIRYSPVNQAYFVMFGDSVQRIFNTYDEAEDYLCDITPE